MKLRIRTFVVSRARSLAVGVVPALADSSANCFSVNSSSTFDRLRVMASPPAKQESSWDAHPAFRGTVPIDTRNFGSCS
jgi:hypothetical protein